VLIGMPAPAPAEKERFQSIVWVMLDEPKLRRRLQASQRIKEEVKEMVGDGLKQRLMHLYKDFGDGSIVFQPTDKQNAAIRSIVRVMHDWLKSVMSALPKSLDGGVVDSQKLASAVLPKFQPADRLFLAGFLATQLVATYIETQSH
jgi:hypothetical protein